MEMIKIDNVSMCFKMANDKISSIKEFVTALLSRKLKFKEFWALKDVSFEVKKGEVVGIIGRNGAGKSTILKIISGILKPTKGKVATRGNIVPMLELGSGFDPDLTGRENIFLNGAILGYSEEFLNGKYDEILEFSELGEFINVPIRNYSSGMMVRLAFSIATVVQPEILIVDEILAVGDENFQKKSKKRMLELMSGGTTVLFVSHDLSQIREMCDRVVWLDKHTVKMFGPAEEVCSQYNIEDEAIPSVDLIDEKFKAYAVKNNIWLLGTEDYGNLGNHQIAVSEIEWAQRTFGDAYEIREIPASRYWKELPYLKRYIKKEDIILGHGGGNLGNQYLPSEDIRRSFIQSFPDNPVIIMPQTIFFLENEQGDKELKNSQAIYDAHPNLLLYTREKQSYIFAKEHFSCDVRIAPDIVMFSDYSDLNVERKTPVLCLRDDIESILKADDKNKVCDILSAFGKVNRVDMQRDYNIEIPEREKYLDDFKMTIASSKVVVTDRLHGMIFCAITRTPCVVIGSYNHKIEGSYDWIRNLSYIEYAYNIDELDRLIEKVIQADHSCYDNVKLIEQFETMSEQVRKYIGL